MIVNVHMTDGRTVFQFAGGKELRQALPGRQEDEGAFAKPRVAAWIKQDDGEWKPVRIRLVRRSSIAFILSAEDTAESEADLPAKAAAEERRRQWEEAHLGVAIPDPHIGVQ